MHGTVIIPVDIGSGRMSFFPDLKYYPEIFSKKLNTPKVVGEWVAFVLHIGDVLT
jgi:hypothetical protein